MTSARNLSSDDDGVRGFGVVGGGRRGECGEIAVKGGEVVCVVVGV